MCICAFLHQCLCLAEGVRSNDLQFRYHIGPAASTSQDPRIQDIVENMTDLIRDVFSQYEQRMTSTIDGLALQKIRLDEILPGEERLLRIEAIADPTVKSPEQIYVDKETMRELYEGLGRLSEREQAYLLYRYGFTDDVEHTMIGSAIHFNLRKSRAKTLEDTAMDNLWLELPWWF